MNLKDWLKERDKSLASLSREIDYAPHHLSGVLIGRYKMGPKLARAIEHSTKGQLKAQDLMKENAIKCEKFREEQEKNQQEKIE